MKRSFALLLAIGFVLPGAAAGQQPTPLLSPRSAEFAAWTPPLSADPGDLRLARIASSGRDGTVLGLAIGAALGLAVGYAFYDVMCEAVDNNCSDSRLTPMLLGAGLFGSLGALVGSIAD